MRLLPRARLLSDSTRATRRGRRVPLPPLLLLLLLVEHRRGFALEVLHVLYECVLILEQGDGYGWCARVNLYTSKARRQQWTRRSRATRTIAAAAWSKTVQPDAACCRSSSNGRIVC